MSTTDTPPNCPGLKTERLTLREIAASDAPALLAIHGDAQAMRWFGTDPLVNLEEAHKLVQTFASWRQMANPGVRWGIARDAAAPLMGSCGLFKWNRGWRCCSIGYELAPAFQGQGYMREALSAALAWGFEQMALNRVEALIHPQNTASIRLVQKLGFVQEGQLREVGYWLGEHRDLLAFGLLRGEFRG
jgi:[ribosomal protein S5]-alanine N-acetyltransferase